MIKPRKLSNVINSMIAVSSNTGFKESMERVKSDVGFTAPELMYTRWNAAHEQLLSFYPDPVKDDESAKVFSEWLDLPEDEVKIKFAHQ